MSLYPKLNGIGLCERLRDRGYLSPILMLTARDTSLDKVIGLDAGADSVYMVKPFQLQELLSSNSGFAPSRTVGNVAYIKIG